MAKGTFNYQMATGYFRHDEEQSGPEHRATTQPSLGLINHTYDTDATFDPDGTKAQWARFVHFVEHLNQLEPGKAQYKIIYLIRHGEGHHNVKEAEVGREAWDAEWSKMDGDGLTTWSDAYLTEKGRGQAKELNKFWQEAIANKTVPLPQRCYTSPLARCLETTKLAYSGLPGLEFKPIVKEKMRERNGEHTCDRRSTRSWIEDNYPKYHIEAGFAEKDELWKADWRESTEEINNRVSQLLDDIFTIEDKSIISFTAHSGLIHALYSVTGHRDVWVAPGAMMPLLVRADSVE